LRTIKADPGSQLRLLDLQATDSALAQLDHRRRTLPEHAELARLKAEHASLSSDLVGADTAVSDLELEQAKAEADLAPVKERLTRNQRRIADGSVPDAKALSSMVAEVDHLKKRIGDLEDAELEIMEQLEQAQAEQNRLRGRVAEVAAAVAEVTARRDEQLAALDEEVGRRRTERASIAPGIDPSLLTLYDRVAASHGGVGAAELRARRCTGCQLDVNAADLRGFAAANVDEVLRCEECSRILVRTANSGL
jgi:predicted  nucleic acid-binding Zn-ribbon protein